MNSRINTLVEICDGLLVSGVGYFPMLFKVCKVLLNVGVPTANCQVVSSLPVGPLEPETSPMTN